MNSNQKGFAYILLIAFVVIGTAGLVFFSWQRGLVKNPLNRYTSTTPTPTLDKITSQIPNADLTTWETYNGTNFSFKYPGGWLKEKSIPTGTGYIQSFLNPLGTLELELTSRTNFNNSTGKPFSLDEILGNIDSYFTIQLGNREGYAILSPRVKESKKYNEVLFFEPNNEFFYTLSLTRITSGTTPTPLSDEEYNLFYQILSTFKFLD